MKSTALILLLAITVLAVTACSSAPADQDQTPAMMDDQPIMNETNATMDEEMAEDASDTQEATTPVTEPALLDLQDPAFQTAADDALKGKGTTTGSGAIYLEVVNHAGTTYYGTVNNSGLVMASAQGQTLQFKNSNFMSQTFTLKDILQQQTMDVPCVDDQEDIGTSDFDVVGYKEYTAPNVLKPYDNAYCQLHIEYADGTYTGEGTANVHFYSYTLKDYDPRQIRFKFVYNE